MKVTDRIKKIARYLYKQNELIKLLKNSEELSKKYKNELDLANKKIEELEVYVNSDFVNQKVKDTEYLLEQYRIKKHAYQKELKENRLRILELENQLQEVTKNKII